MNNPLNSNNLFQNNPPNPQYVPGANTLYQPNPFQTLNAYNQNRLPNLNYSLPGQNPFQNSYSARNNLNSPLPGMNQAGAVNPFDPNVNFLQRANNSMLNPRQTFFQNTQNMANVMQEPELEINQYIAERMLERDKMKQQTEEINKRLEGEDEDDEIEKIEKKEAMKEKEDDKKKKRK